MKKVFSIVLVVLSTLSCKGHKPKEKDEKVLLFTEFITPNYELYKPNTEAKAVLVLFGGYPEVASDIKREFNILNQAKDNEIAVIFSNYNQKLWFEENELQELTEQLKKTFDNHKLPKDNIYFGGFSSGGNVSFLTSSYLTNNPEIGLIPKGVFIVDSPTDLAELYFNSEANIKRNFSKSSIQESTWLIESLGNRFGNPNKNLKEYEKHSVFTLRTGNIYNIKSLQKAKIRMYTEPDTLWWKKNRMRDYQETNAYLIEKLSKKLKNSGFADIEYIPTKNRGYRANGDRHPHSWAIVEADDLINWILDK